MEKESVMRTSNKDARQYVQRKVEFKGSNTFAEMQNSAGDTMRYVVYSYGYHFPMYIAEWQVGDRENATWYENADKYSVSTSKQQSQLRPTSDTIKLRTDDMKSVALGGIVRLIENKAKEFV
jgi:hypothetical protein